MVIAALVAGAALALAVPGPAVACRCVAESTGRQVARADVVFSGTLTGSEQTDPGDDEVISSADPVLHSFVVERSWKGEVGATAEVESVRFGASCGLVGMRDGVRYVVFADADRDGGLSANLCGGTGRATDRLVGGVETAVGLPPTVAVPPLPVPSAVPSGVPPASPDDGPGWAWLAGGLVVAAGMALAALRWCVARR